MLWLPTGFSWRELWEARLISGVNWRSSIPNGHLLTMVNCVPGAEKRSTSAGVQFDGSATSNINCGVIHNAAAKLWVSFRFKPDQDYNLGDGDQHMWTKRLNGSNYVTVRLESVTGSIRFFAVAGAPAPAVFTCYSTETSWNAGQCYRVIASMSDDGATQVDARLITDNGTPVTDTDAGRNPTPNGGDVVIGDFDDPGTGTGFKGVISDVYIGTDDLTPQEETNLYNGIPPADAVNVFKLNEGGGSVAHDDGSGADDGTLDTSCEWAWDGVQEPVASFNGIDQYARTPGTTKVDISGYLSLVWVGKIKDIRSLTALDTPYFIDARIGSNNRMILYTTGASLVYYMEGNNLISTAFFDIPYSIDDYIIIVGTFGSDYITRIYVDGVFKDDGGVGDAVIAGGARFDVGVSYDLVNHTSSSAPIMIGLIEGAFNNQQVYNWSQFINRHYGLGITM